MIWQPKIGQEVRINYGDKTRSNNFIAKADMPLQGVECEIFSVSKGPGPMNVLVIIVCAPAIGFYFEVIPKGNLVAT